jgi:Putative MetA-pathway of phenol degradation
MNRFLRKVSTVSVALCGTGIAPSALAGQPLETETARLPAQGHGTAQVAFEYLKSEDAKETLIPFVLEYGLTDRLKLTVEPVAYQKIKPNVGPSVHGAGDTEVLLTWLASPETDSSPGFAISGEVKVPTAKTALGGTKKADFRLAGIVSKTVGDIDLDANLGFTVVGSPRGTKLPNFIEYAAAISWHVDPKVTLMAELVGATAVGGKETVANSAVEGFGTSITGLIGATYEVSDRILLSIGVTHDNGNTFSVKPGLTFRF